MRHAGEEAPEQLVSPTNDLPAPEFPDQAHRGEYMAGLAGCADCHTPSVKGKPIAGLEFAGGSRFEGPWGEVSSANLTPDPSGISYYDEAMFLTGVAEAIRATGGCNKRRLCESECGRPEGSGAASPGHLICFDGGQQ